MSDPLVFIPGLLCTEALFAHQISSFSNQAILVADHRKKDRIEDIADELLLSAPEEFCLITLSMGGYIAMEIMRKAPERVKKLALMNTNARADTEAQTKRRHTLIELARRKEFSKVPNLLYPSFVHEDRENDQELKSIVVEMAINTGIEAFINQETAIINRIDSRPALKDISCPTLVIAGDGDRLTPLEMLTEIHKHIPTSELHIVEDTGHLPTLEAPEKTTSILKTFLKKN